MEEELKVDSVMDTNDINNETQIDTTNEDSKEIEIINTTVNVMYSVKTKEFIEDYNKTLEDKENDLNKSMEELDKRVEERLEALRPEIIEQVKAEIVKEINDNYATKIELYEKYIELVEVPSEEKVEENIEEDIANENLELDKVIEEEKVENNDNTLETNESIENA